MPECVMILAKSNVGKCSNAKCDECILKIWVHHSNIFIELPDHTGISIDKAGVQSLIKDLEGFLSA